MKNNLIVLRFWNENDDEVLLQLEHVQQIAEALQDVCIRLLVGDQERLKAQFGVEHVHVRLGAAEPGSLRLGFRILPSGTGPRPTLQDIAAGIEIAEALGPILLWVGISTGFFLPNQADSEAEKAVRIEAAGAYLADRSVRSGIERLVAASLHAGADHVEIIIPGMKDCQMTDEPSSSPELLGRDAPPLPGQHRGRHEGQITITGRPIPFRVKGEEKDLYIGRFEYTVREGNRDQKVNLTLLVDWQSSEPIPAINEAREIRGIVSHLDLNEVSALAPIDRLYRQVRGLVVVEGVRGYR